MIFSILCFLSGILVVQQFSELPEPFWIINFLLLACCMGLMRLWRLMFFVMGCFWAISFASMAMQYSLSPAHEGQHIQVVGKIIGLPRNNERSVRFDFSVIKAELLNSASSEPEQLDLNKIRLNWYYPKQLPKSGQVWQFTVKLKKPHGYFNPAGFDYERGLFMQKIEATGYIRNKPSPQLLADNSTIQNIDTIRQFIAEKLDELVEKTESRALIKALTIGDKSDLTAMQWQVFRDTGTVHLLAISGLHIGLIASLVYLLALKLFIACRLQSSQVYAATLTLIIAFLYSALAGFSLPTQRALIMLAVVMTAIIWQRHTTGLHILAIAMLVVLIVDPLAVLSAGFWLSFLAVFLIIYTLAGRLVKLGYWQSALRIHWVTAIGLSPVILLYFQQVSIISPVANLFVVPVISFLVVPLCLLGVVSIFFAPVVAQSIYDLLDKLLQGVSWVLSEMASWPFVTLKISTPSSEAMMFALMGVLILFLPKGMPARWLSIVFMLPMFFQPKEQLQSAEIKLTVLDVGQGLSVVVETSQHILLFDTGAKYSKHYDMGSAVIVPFLNSQGIDTVDTMVISHGDNDHIGGAHSILRQMSVKRVLTSVPEQLGQYAPVVCVVGQSWVWDQVLFEVLSPPPLGLLKGDNNNSCVIKISTEKGSILLTGDIEKEAENWLLQQWGNALKSDILIAPHHGSKTSSGRSFLLQVKPEMVLVSSGYRNRFSFPHLEVVERYKNININVFNTASDGALIVKLKEGHWMLELSREKYGKYWNN